MKDKLSKVYQETLMDIFYMYNLFVDETIDDCTWYIRNGDRMFLDEDEILLEKFWIIKAYLDTENVRLKKE